VSEEIVHQEHNVERIIYTLDPEIAGDYLLTLGLITFETDDQTKDKAVNLMTGVFPVHIAQSVDAINYQGVIHPVMPLSLNIPVDITAENAEKYESSRHIESSDIVTHRRLLSTNLKVALTFIFITSFKLFMIIFISRKVTGKDFGIKILSIINVKQKALIGLASLKEKGYVPTKRYDDYYVALTHIVRAYLEEGFDVRAASLTTPEFLKYASGHSIFTEGQREKLAAFLQQADAVKFAMKEPTQNECNEAFNTAKTIINDLSVG